MNAKNPIMTTLEYLTGLRVMRQPPLGTDRIRYRRDHPYRMRVGIDV